MSAAKDADPRANFGTPTTRARFIIEHSDMLVSGAHFRELLTDLLDEMAELRNPTPPIAEVRIPEPMAPQPMAPQPILKEALDIIWGDREKTYGAPAFNLETIAEFWTIWLKRRHNVIIALMPEDVCHMMVLLKMARLLNDPIHRDSLTDGAGYLGLVDRINQPMQEKPA